MDNSNNNLEILVLFEEVPIIPQPTVVNVGVNTDVPENTDASANAIANNNTNVKPKKKDNTIDRLVDAIKKQKKRGVKEYHFRPALIDGVYCYFVIYFKYNILTVESINVKYRFSYNGRQLLVPYVLYHVKITSIRKAVENVQKIYSTYKQKNGDIMSLENYNIMKLEESVLPYSASEVCCICFENTTDTTDCGHFICFVCRDKCCIQEKFSCPICRKENTLNIYNNHMHLINNTDYTELNRIFVNKLFPSRVSRYIVQYEDDETEEGEESEESEESSLGSESETEEIDSIS
jgi:hypothetical protein